MAHFALACPDDAGHVLAIGTVGRELVDRGHRITLIARKKAAPLAEQLDLPFCELKTDGIAWPDSRLLCKVFSAFGNGWMIGLRSAFEWDVRVMIEKLTPMIAELKIDGLLIDQNFAGGGTAAELAGVPFVTICSALIWHEEPGVPPSYTSWPYREGPLARLRNRAGFAGWHWYMHPVMRAVNRARKTHGLSPLQRVDDVFSPLAQLSNMCVGFDYPRRSLPPQFHYVGSLAAARKLKNDQDFPWEKLDGRPLVFASLGTVADHANPPVFRKIVAACAGLDAQVVLALGNWKGEFGNLRDELAALAENVIVVDFAPQMALLERAALLITHGGTNTVLEALLCGVPMLALPRSADQLAISARAVRAGVGLRASFQASTSSELHALIKRALSDESIRLRAEELRQAMQDAGGARRAAEISEMALITRKPVLREELKQA